MSKMKKVLLFVLVGVMALTTVACGNNGEQEDVTNDNTQSENVSEESSMTKIGLLTGVAGLGDKSFNDLAYDGAKKAEEELGIELKVVEPIDLASTEGLIRDLASAGNDMVIAVGFDMAEPMEVVSQEFPETKFAIVDAVVDQPNVQSLVFKEHEGSFLIGALSAMMSETKKVGCIPAMDVPFLNRFTKAYEQGVKHIDPDIDVVIQPIGSDFNAFNDPGKAKDIALSMYSQNIDIIYPVAGGSGTGVFEAAKEVEKYALGINSDQDYMAEGLVLASMMKRVDVAVLESIKDVVNDSFDGGIKSFGLDNNGVGLSEMKYTKDIIGEDNIKQLEEIKQQIIDGSIEVIDVTAE